MRLTRQAEIAVHILLLCAMNGSDTPTTTRRAAEHVATTKDHAAQVVAKLSRTSYLACERGRAGGIRLARPAASIKVGEVLRLIDPALGTTGDEAFGINVSAGAFAVLRQAANAAFLSTFDSFTIADLAGDPTHGRLACLDCDLNLLVRQGRTLSRLRNGHAAWGPHARPTSATAHAA